MMGIKEKLPAVANNHSINICPRILNPQIMTNLKLIWAKRLQSPAMHCHAYILACYLRQFVISCWILIMPFQISACGWIIPKGYILGSFFITVLTFFQGLQSVLKTALQKMVCCTMDHHLKSHTMVQLVLLCKWKVSTFRRRCHLIKIALMHRVEVPYAQILQFPDTSIRFGLAFLVILVWIYKAWL